MNEKLSQIVADLFAKAKGGEGLSSEINHVRDEIRKVIEGEETVYGKFQGLVESLREVIPDEKQRYRIAVKALSTTAKLSPQEIVAAVDKQLEELKILEKALIPGLPGLPEELQTMEAKAREIRNEISSLREKTAQLEKEEKEIVDRIAGREKEMGVVEKAMREVFGGIGAEITSTKKRVQELSAASTAANPATAADTVKNDVPGEKRQISEQKNTVAQLSSPQKICPMCGGQMSFFMTTNIWQCYACAYEESEKDEVQGKKGKPGGQAIFPEPGEQTNAPEPGGQNIFPEPGEHSNPPKPSGQSIFPEPGEQSNAPEPCEQKVIPEPTPASDGKQKCPMCGGRMDYYIAEGKWQCYSCGFETEKDAGQGKSEEKRGRSNVLLAIPLTESLFDQSSTTRPSPGYWKPKKASLFSKGLSTIKKKTCPGCAKKMQWHDSEKFWQCPHCGYERRI